MTKQWLNRLLKFCREKIGNIIMNDETKKKFQRILEFIIIFIYFLLLNYEYITLNRLVYLLKIIMLFYLYLFIKWIFEKICDWLKYTLRYNIMEFYPLEAIEKKKRGELFWTAGLNQQLQEYFLDNPDKKIEFLEIINDFIKILKVINFFYYITSPVVWFIKNNISYLYYNFFLEINEKYDDNSFTKKTIYFIWEDLIISPLIRFNILLYKWIIRLREKSIIEIIFLRIEGLIFVTLVTTNLVSFISQFIIIKYYYVIILIYVLLVISKWFEDFGTGIIWNLFYYNTLCNNEGKLSISLYPNSFHTIIWTRQDLSSLYKLKKAIIYSINDFYESIGEEQQKILFISKYDDSISNKIRDKKNWQNEILLGWLLDLKTHKKNKMNYELGCKIYNLVNEGFYFLNYINIEIIKLYMQINKEEAELLNQIKLSKLKELFIIYWDLLQNINMEYDGNCTIKWGNYLRFEYAIEEHNDETEEYNEETDHSSIFLDHLRDELSINKKDVNLPSNLYDIIDYFNYQIHLDELKSAEIVELNQEAFRNSNLKSFNEVATKVEETVKEWRKEWENNNNKQQ